MAVTFDSRTPTTFSILSGDNQVGTAGETLPNPFVVEVQDGNGTTFEGVPVTFSVTSSEGTLSATNTTTDANGQAESTLTLSSDAPATITVSVSAADITETLTFNVTHTNAVNIPDTNLRAAIETALSKAPGTPITHATIGTLTDLEGGSQKISDLTGIEHATNLTKLDVNNNAISDITPLTGLTKLKHLVLSDNPISDITPLTALTKLEILNLDDTAISDITSLAGLIHLTGLLLDNTAISDLTPLTTLTKLTLLFLNDTAISDLTPLAGLVYLTHLTLDQTVISDLTPLAGLTRMKSLYLHNTAISDLTPLAGLTRMEELYLHNTVVSNVTPLAGLAKIKSLNLAHTAISDITPLAGLTSLLNLFLNDTAISDLTPLAGLTRMKRLYLNNTAISDITPLLENTGIGDADDVVDLHNTLLNYESLYTDMSTLQARGGNIIFDSRTPTTLLVISGDNQAGTAGEALPNPFIIEIQDQNGVGFEGVPMRFSVHTQQGELSSTNPNAVPISITGRVIGLDMSTDADGRAQATFSLGTDYLTYSVWVATTVSDDTSPVNLNVGLAVDLNGDGILDVADLGLVVSDFGATVAADADPNPDVNRDGTVDRNDFLLISDAILAQAEAGSAAPSVHVLPIPGVTAGMVREWIQEIKRRSNGDPRFDGGIMLLEQLLASLQPEETALLANYPNPFNPETWIPYQLAEAGKVSITIYAVNGTVIRTLDLGWIPVGTYHSRQFAAYWDGRNAFGETVASGIYFYTLTVEDFTATRKMLIRK